MAIVIRSGGSKSAQQRYKSSIEAVLMEVRQTRTGRIVLDRLARAPFDVIVEPNLAADGFDNAMENAASHVHSGNNDLGKSARGSRSMVEFSPGRVGKKQLFGAPHEFLIHELSHSLRTVYGASRLTKSGDLLPMSGDFGNVEEFFATMVTSVHSSELGRTVFGNHGNWKLPSVDLLRKPPFDRRLREFNVSMPDFCKEMSTISHKTAPFNPFRDISTRP
jgi:hypothetical protein